MGRFTTGCRVENHVDRERNFHLARLLVDTGGEYTWVPASKLAGIGVGREKNFIDKGVTGAMLMTRYIPYTLSSLAVHYRQNMPRVRRFVSRKVTPRLRTRRKQGGGSTPSGEREK